MVAVNINLELVDIGDLQDGRDDKDKSENHFQRDGRYVLQFTQFFSQVTTE